MHEPIDLPDGVVYLVPLEGPPPKIPVDPTNDSDASVRPPPSPEAGQRSSS